MDVRRSADPEEWAEAIRGERELVEAAGLGTLAARLDTLYIGGGTPSVLGPRAMAVVAEAIGPERLRGEGLEWTAEANPESFSTDVAEGWRRAGLGRLSLGVQSFQEGPLRWMGRLHGAEGAVAAVRRARAAGLADLSVDLIFGLPDSVDRDWSVDLAQAVALEPPHVSLYGLTAEKGTPLGRGVAEGTIRMADDDRYAEEYLMAHERLTAAGYRHYEVSNFARPGFESRHNQAYWVGSPYLGFGNGAHSFVPPVRRGNVRDWGEYRRAVQDGRLPESAWDPVGARERDMERLWLGLRTAVGLSRGDLEARGAGGTLRRWESRGLIHPDPERVRMTVEGWLVLDSLVLELDRALEGAPDGG